MFARSMFPAAPEPSITAPAHQTCNRSYAADEEVFRAFAVSGLANEAARTLWDGPIRRSFRKSPPFGRMFASKIYMREIRSAAGLYLVVCRGFGVVGKRGYGLEAAVAEPSVGALRGILGRHGSTVE